MDCREKQFLFVHDSEDQLRVLVKLGLSRERPSLEIGCFLGKLKKFVVSERSLKMELSSGIRSF